MIFLKIGLMIILFLLLSESAGILIDNVKKIAERFKIKTFIIGIILGFLTTIPEFFLGINAIRSGIESVSLGNLLGGIIVIFSLVFGLTLVLNKKIDTDGNTKKISLNLLYILIPVAFCFKGTFGFIDGLFFLILYFILIFYTNSGYKVKEEVEIIEKNKGIINRIKEFKDRSFLKEIFLFILGLIGLVVLSNITIDLFEDILIQFNVSKFVIGLLMFSLGTNLPEIIVTIKSAIKKNSDLSINHLIGSAMVNIVVLSLLSLFTTFKINVNFSFISMFIFMIISMSLVILFHRTNKSFSRKEGVALLLIYICFLISQIFFIAK